uniref:MHD domain-containing protein n=1 Tax=Ananas comosus var. bracteatus TaxID=296719 RepID=A0A6V7PSX4_ANACO|nr:unnamed protein product [Ananas comosus var. bracteatus]
MAEELSAAAASSPAEELSAAEEWLRKLSTAASRVLAEPRRPRRVGHRESPLARPALPRRHRSRHQHLVNNSAVYLMSVYSLGHTAEIMDFGYPQNLSPEILKLYITQQGFRSPFSSKSSDRPVPNATLQVTGAVGWRREGLVYKKNEVFLDIVASVNLLMSSKGSVLRCDVTGKILMKSARAAEIEVGSKTCGIVDIASEGKSIDLRELEYIHVHKTARLLEAAACAGPSSGERRTAPWRASANGGEGPGGRQGHLPKLMGLGRARQFAAELVGKAEEELAGFDARKAAPLYHLARFIADRQN